MALLTASCGAQVGDAPLPPRPAVVDVTMRDYGFHYDRRSIPRGRVVFRGRNAGRRTHELILERLPEDFPPIDLQLRSKTRKSAPAVAYLRELRPGASDAFATELGPGRYAMVCFVEDRDGVQHALKGMSSEFRVR